MPAAHSACCFLHVPHPQEFAAQVLGQIVSFRFWQIYIPLEMRVGISNAQTHAI